MLEGQTDDHSFCTHCVPETWTRYWQEVAGDAQVTGETASRVPLISEIGCDSTAEDGFRGLSGGAATAMMQYRSAWWGVESEGCSRSREGVEVGEDKNVVAMSGISLH